MEVAKIADKYYHTIVFESMYNAEFPISCQTYFSSTYEPLNVIIGMIPQCTIPNIEVNITKNIVNYRVNSFVIFKNYKPIDFTNPLQVVINSLVQLQDLQMETIAKLLLHHSNEIKEKYVYRFFYVDDESTVKDFTVEEDLLPYIPIYTTFNKSHAKAVLKQFNKTFGRKKIVKFKTKLSKYAGVIEKIKNSYNSQEE